MFTKAILNSAALLSLLITMLFVPLVHAAPFNNGLAILEQISFSEPITGDIDVSSRTMSVDPWLFFGSPVHTSNVEILGPGNYSRPGGDFDVPPGHVGAHMLLTWNFNDVHTVMVWNVTPAGSYAEYRAIDSDGDGVPGHAMNNGPFVGINVHYQFEAEPFGDPEPGVYLTLKVDGGPIQECTGDSSAEVSIYAMPTLLGGAELDEIYWTVDGEDAGSGNSLTETLALGDHVIEATAVTTTGESDDATTDVTVRDTTRPVVTVDFISNNGRGDAIDVVNETASPGRYQVSIKATDTCDPAPVVSYSDAREVMLIEDGDAITVTNSTDNLKLPRTGVTVHASGRDASGNFSYAVYKTLKLR